MAAFEYKVKSEKMFLLFRSGIYIFDMLFNRIPKESFEDFQINSCQIFQTHASMPHKMVVL